MLYVLVPICAVGALIMILQGASIARRRRPRSSIRRTPPRQSPRHAQRTTREGSNLRPTSKALVDLVKDLTAKLAAENPNTPIPSDLRTTSAKRPGSGHHAGWGAVPGARGLPEDKVRHLVEQYISGRLLGIFGEPHANVLRLNLALDEMKG